MSIRDPRTIRYGAAVFAVIAGAACAAALTNSVGNTIATVLIGCGLLAIVYFLLRDMGLLDTGERPSSSGSSGSSAPPGNGGDPHDGGDARHDAEPRHDDGPDHGSAGGPGASPGTRRGVNVPRPDRMRGQRRRLH